MEHAFKGVRDAESLNTIAAAMRFWDGPGRMDELDGKHLNNYVHRGLRAVSKRARRRRRRGRRVTDHGR